MASRSFRRSFRISWSACRTDRRGAACGGLSFGMTGQEAIQDGRRPDADVAQEFAEQGFVDRVFAGQPVESRGTRQFAGAHKFGNLGIVQTEAGSQEVELILD